MTEPGNPNPSKPAATCGCSPETRAIILDTAERLFGENGVEGTSVRDITRAAGVNLGAINYHFGTKDALVMAVFVRRLEPLSQERMRLLDGLEQKACGQPLALEDVLRAFFDPIIQSEENGELARTSLARLISRCFQEPNPELKALLKRHFEHVCTRFDNAILRTVPELTPAEVFWRINFLIGALNHALDMWARFEWIPIMGLDHKPERPSREALIDQLIAFTAGGIRARSLWNAKQEPTS
ncbi:MAG: TetR/AcrR family transcriptional regulator [Chthoniobacteraceae bacterium]|nr:TetR/AcrR family transcriptional regulator [Chthoniobacteraceae bacterium]